MQQVRIARSRLRYIMLVLGNFSTQRPRYEIAQARALEWLAEVHSASEATRQSLPELERKAFAERYTKLLQRTACGPERIGSRGHAISDLPAANFDEQARRGPHHAPLELYDVSRHPRGLGSAARSGLFSSVVNAYFEREFADEQRPPSELIHVTCTGYVAPSGAQRVVASKGWGDVTQVTHAYHMGCYAAFPAIRIAAGQLGLAAAFASKSAERRADIVHTELCTLHLDPSDHSAEQCVVQSLFGDGFVRYSLRETEASPGLEVLALSESILPDSAHSMGWSAGDFGMHMTLARDVPERIAGRLRSFVSALFAKAGLEIEPGLAQIVAAVHPGGPKIIDRVRDVLELRDEQMAASRQVLFDHGNMSSATLPHVWQRIVADDAVRVGTPILSLAFGPGLTVCGGIFRKC